MRVILSPPTTVTSNMNANLRTWELPESLGLSIEEVIAKARQGYAVRIFPKFGGFGNDYEFIPRPLQVIGGKLTIVAQPQIFIIEEYKTTSFLGNYGAGRTISTQSLFPSEKTKITVKTFRELTEVKSRAENIIDSMSKESAAEMENLLENENKQSNTSSEEKSRKKNFGFKISFPLLGGTGSAGGSAESSKNTKSSRETNARNLSKALSKHVDKSNASREVKINTNTEENSTERDETAIEREFSNPNQSRVLNFVFRELLQEYISITYLTDIKVGFTNGNPEYDALVPIEELDSFLDTYIQDAALKADIKAQILYEYGTMPSKSNVNETVDFLEEITVTIQENATTQGTESYFTKKQGVNDRYRPNPAIDFTLTVPGVIVGVDSNILRTPAVVVDSLLGQGEALDCYAQQLQEQVVEKSRLENQKLSTALSIIESITDPVQKAEAFSNMFNPQPQTIVRQA